MNLVRVLSLLPLIGLVASETVHASGGVIEINADCASVGCLAGDDPGLPIWISQPGSYLLTSDLSVAALAGEAIVVQAIGRVELDLGGHTITGPMTCPGPPTACTPVTTSASYGVSFFARAGRLHHGSISGFVTGVLLSPSPGTVLENLIINGNRDHGISTGVNGIDNVSAELVLRNMHIARNGVGVFTAVGTGVPNLLLDHVGVYNNYGTGVEASAPLIVLDSIFAGNVSVAIFNVGHELASGRSVYVRNNGIPTNQQFVAALSRNMGGNVCSSAACF